MSLLQLSHHRWISSGPAFCRLVALCLDRTRCGRRYLTHGNLRGEVTALEGMRAPAVVGDWQLHATVDTSFGVFCAERLGFTTSRHHHYRRLDKYLPLLRCIILILKLLLYSGREMIERHLFPHALNPWINNCVRGFLMERLIYGFQSAGALFFLVNYLNWWLV